MSAAGIDVSNWQGSVDWAAVAASGMQFGIVKATEGVSFADPFFTANWQGMARANLSRGAYHFCRPDQNTPQAEAAYFVAHLKAAGGLAVGDVVAGDFEVGSADLGDWALAWLQAVGALVGFKPLLYSSPAFITEHGLNTSALAEYGLWIAHYGVSRPTVPSPWPFWALWQHNDKGQCDGITGPVDLDVVNGDIDVFRKYGKPALSKAPFDATARLALISYVANGSGVKDIVDWVSQHEDVA